MYRQIVYENFDGGGTLPGRTTTTGGATWQSDTNVTNSNNYDWTLNASTGRAELSTSGQAGRHINVLNRNFPSVATYEAVLQCDNNTYGIYTGMCFRWTRGATPATSTGYFWEIRYTSTAGGEMILQYSLYRASNGSWDLRPIYSLETAGQGHVAPWTIVLTAETVGSNITLKKNGTVIGTTVDSTYPTGTAGIEALRSSTGAGPVYNGMTSFSVIDTTSEPLMVV